MTEIWSQYERWMRSRVLWRSARAYTASSVKLLTRTRPIRRSLGKLASSNTDISVRRVQSKGKMRTRRMERACDPLAKSTYRNRVQHLASDLMDLSVMFAA